MPDFSKLKNSFSIHSLLPLVIMVVMTPHLSSTAVVFPVIIFIICSWFVLHTIGIIPLPGRWLRLVLVFSSLFLLAFNYGINFSQQAALTMLCLMMSLKLLEIKSETDRRNIFVVIYLAYFILIIHFLHSQKFTLLLFALPATLLLTVLLQGFTRQPQPPLPLSTSLKLIMPVFIKAVPVAILLFVFFPRIPGPLWSLPSDSSQATTGLTDTMYPGSVTVLTDSDEIAFRVHFITPPPAADKLYWRGPVLNKTDGFLWQQQKPTPLKKPFSSVVKNQQNPVIYLITLEPHQRKMLFTLEMANRIQSETINDYYVSTDLQLLNSYNIHQLTQYEATSNTEFYLDKVSQQEIQDALLLSGDANPQTRAFGRQLRERYQQDQDIVEQALAYIRQEPFYYSRQPASMVTNPADEFLFQYKRGFCEHYASSFVIMMRAAGIPSRVVTGYQGMEKNPVGNYFIVRQSNAHAWAEVWLENQGWVRVDPTTVIPPERIEANVLNTDLNRLAYSSLVIPDLPSLSLQQQTLLYNAWKQVSASIDNIRYSWNNWILGYDRDKQNRLLNWLGFKASWKVLIQLLLGSIILVVLLFQVHALLQHRKRLDRVQVYYKKFLAKLERKGLEISSSMGPRTIEQSATRAFPASGDSIRHIINHYIELRYGPKKPEGEDQFRREVRHFRVK